MTKSAFTPAEQAPEMQDVEVIFTASYRTKLRLPVGATKDDIEAAACDIPILDTPEVEYISGTFELDNATDAKKNQYLFDAEDDGQS